MNVVILLGAKTYVNPLLRMMEFPLLQKLTDVIMTINLTYFIKGGEP